MDKINTPLSQPAELKKFTPFSRFALNKFDFAHGVKSLGTCPECGHPVIELDGRYACFKSTDGSCSFTIAIDDIEATLEQHLTEYVLDIILGDDEEIRWLFRSVLGCMPGQAVVKWDNYKGYIFEYFEMQLVRDSSGRWELRITRDDEEAAASAREGLDILLNEDFCE